MPLQNESNNQIVVAKQKNAKTGNGSAGANYAASSQIPTAPRSRSSFCNQLYSNFDKRTTRQPYTQIKQNICTILGSTQTPTTPTNGSQALLSLVRFGSIGLGWVGLGWVGVGVVWSD